MSTAATVARNTFLGFLGQVAVKAVQLGTSIVLARALQTEGFGDLGYIIALQTFFLFVGDFGVEKIALKEIARAPAEAARLAGAAMTLRALLSVGAAALAAAFLFVAAPTARLAWLGALACLSLPLTVASLYPAYFQARLRVGRAAWFTFVQGAITSGLMLLAALAPAFLPDLRAVRLEIVVAAAAIAPLPSLAVSAWMARGDIRPRIAIDPALWRSFLRQSAPLAFNTLCILLCVRADQVILRSLKGAEALGQYVAAVRFFDAFAIIPAVLLLSGFPLMSRYDRDSPARYLETARWSYKILATFVLPVALATTVLADAIVVLLYGEPYAPAAGPLAILMWSLFFSFTSMVTFDAVTAAGRQRVFFGISLFTTAANLALNFLLIPPYGARGAAVAVLISSTLNLPFLAWLRETRPLIRTLATVSWRPLLATGILALALAGGVPLRAFLLALLPAYLALLLATGGLGRRDLDLIREIFRRAG